MPKAAETMLREKSMIGESSGLCGKLLVCGSEVSEACLLLDWQSKSKT
jgi:hypothetical protein